MTQTAATPVTDRGHRRFRLIGALVSSAVLLAAAIACTPPAALAPRPLPAPPPLPLPVTNNAVAAGRIGTETWVFSALGVDATKRWSGITRRADYWTTRTGNWRALPDVPGPAGRLAATAQVVRGRLVVLGGYSVDSTGAERSVPSVDVLDPVTLRWSAGAPMPVPVDDAVSGVWRDSLVFVVSGWHDTDNVRDVQVYDVALDRWSAATPIPGPGVFGHTGGVVGNTIVYIDGAAPQVVGARYALISQVWVGHIDPSTPTSIRWEAGPTHPGAALYRAAAATCGSRLVVAGGTANPYNYNGIGYDGRPSAPLAYAFEFDTATGAWRERAPMPAATMDHRGLVRVGRAGWILGGMRAQQRVSADIVTFPLDDCDH